MRALLDDPALIHDDDAVGAFDGGEAVRDDERRAALHQRLERLLHGGLALRVERVRRLVEKQDRRALQDRAGDREPLALAAGKRDAALADQRLVAVGQGGEERVGMRGARRRADRGGVGLERRRSRCSPPR